VQQPGTAFEYLQFSVAQERNLAKRLAREMIGVVTIEWNRADCVAEIGFFTRPPQP